mmetsp:Transcript_3854/g.5727  ORF Transcript_3854/g.5727 Transcript_3854/m.5727 type:complete len:108 (+) Transcript_3854:20-343(+)
MQLNISCIVKFAVIQLCWLPQDSQNHYLFFNVVLLYHLSSTFLSNIPSPPPPINHSSSHHISIASPDFLSLSRESRSNISATSLASSLSTSIPDIVDILSLDTIAGS